MKVPVVFDRSVALSSRSFAVLRYRADSTSINSHYWISRLAEERLKSDVRKVPMGVNPETALRVPSSFSGRLAQTEKEFGDKIGTSYRWRRLLVLVMLSSALERYLAAVTRMAILSDPSLTPGFPKRIDGVLLKKYSLNLQLPDTSGITGGSWSQRLSVYERLFKAVPPDLKAAHSDLEFLRTTRNRIAHALGVDDNFGKAEKDHYGTLDVLLGARRPVQLEQVRVSDGRIVSLLGSVQMAVDAVDRHLLRDFIGAFEMVELYLEWSRDPKAFEARAGIEIAHHVGSDNRFRKVQGMLFGTSAGTQYYRGLRKYVDEI